MKVPHENKFFAMLCRHLWCVHLWAWIEKILSCGATWCLQSLPIFTTLFCQTLTKKSQKRQHFKKVAQAGNKISFSGASTYLIKKIDLLRSRYALDGPMYGIGMKKFYWQAHVRGLPSLVIFTTFCGKFGQLLSTF